MLRLTTLSVSDLLAAFRSSEPAPGGGSASALAGAVGASLLTMVASLPKPRAAGAGDLERLRSAGAACGGLSERLSELVDRDTDAYSEVVAAYRLPKATDEEKTARTAAIRQAMRAAIEAPLAVMRACHEAIHHSSVVAALGNPNASSDVRVALELLRAGLRGAGYNVAINLGTLKEAPYAESARAEAEKLTREGDEEIARVTREELNH